MKIENNKKWLSLALSNSVPLDIEHTFLYISVLNQFQKITLECFLW